MIICADDFGLSSAVNKAILRLVDIKRLSAVSCIVTADSAVSEFGELRAISVGIDLGLHLTLTDALPLSSPPINSGLVDGQGRFLSFKKILMSAYAGRLNSDALVAEIKLQIDAFARHFGRHPDFIDGHQHIQQMPIIRDFLLKTVLSEYRNSKVYIRSSGLPWRWYSQNLLRFRPLYSIPNLSIQIAGLRLKSLLNKMGISTNRYLLGFHPVKPKFNFKDIFQAYLRMNPERSDIFFCHPGFVSDATRLRDQLVEFRLDVFNFLQSSASVDLLQEKGVCINKMAYQGRD